MHIHILCIYYAYTYIMVYYGIIHYIVYINFAMHLHICIRPLNYFIVTFIHGVISYCECIFRIFLCHPTLSLACEFCISKRRKLYDQQKEENICPISAWKCIFPPLHVPTDMVWYGMYLCTNNNEPPEGNILQLRQRLEKSFLQ